jgi:serine/threonine-protein kinase
MLTKSGAKLLDFGLAKLQAAETPTNLSALPTEQANLTAEGTILGTLQYMAPEQLEGKEADSRTDIFAFGAVVYEMATGKKAFEGKSQASLIGAILKDDPPPMSELQPMTPASLDHIVRRCLAKEPDKRWQAASDVMEELKWVTEVETSVDLSPAVATPPVWKRAVPLAITAGVAMVMVIGLALWSLIPITSKPLTKLAINTPADAPLAQDFLNEVAISPDGRTIVYQARLGGQTRLYLRHLDDVAIVPMSGTEGALDPFFSPDGQSVAFVVPGQLKRVSIKGGSPITVCQMPTLMFGGSWVENTIFFGGDGGLFRVTAAGGEPESLAVPDFDKGEREYNHPSILPDGKSVLFGIQGRDRWQIAVLSLDTGEKRILLDEAKQAHYTSSGHLVYEQPQTGNLMAAPFDFSTLEIIGDPVPVLQGVRQDGFAVDYTFSNNGTLVYVSSGEGAQRRLVWVDRDGTIKPVTETMREFEEPRISPDGMRLSVTIWGERARHVWMYEIDRGILSQFPVEGGETSRAIWTPDGKRLIFGFNQAGAGSDIYWMSSDGSGEATELITSINPLFPTSWAQGGLVAYVELANTGGGGDIFVSSVEGERTTEPVIATPQYDESNAIFSPNGGWIAFTSNRSGRHEVYVKPFPGEGGVQQISADGGLEPVWAQNGKELFYRNGREMISVLVQTGATFKAEKPRLLFEGSYSYNFTGKTSNYDVTPDGQRFLMVEEAEEGQTQIQVVLNWFEELKRLVPTDN